MTSPEQRMAQLLASFGSPQACAAELLCDRHPADAVAFTVVESDLTSRDLTFGELYESSARLASALAKLGVGRGDRVATLMGKSAELVVALLAIWRLGAVHVPLFTAFAPSAIAIRITDNATKVVIADTDQRAKIDPSPDIPANAPWQVITTGPATGEDLAFAELVAGHPPLERALPAGGDAPLIELFTSGTTGSPKGVPVPLRAVAALAMYQEYGLDHQPSDVFWNAADPGWAYGLYYAIVAPLALGRTSLLLHAGFSAALTWSVLSRFAVTNFAAAPTVYRALRQADAPVPDGLQLRHCSSAGEPLTSEVIPWAEQTLGVAVLDHYGQTEVGMVIANAWHPALRTEVPPGSMGRALPGWTVQTLRLDDDAPAGAGETGRVAVDCANSPLMWFSGYQDAPDRTAERFSPDRRWYYTGDTAAKDQDGHLFFAARDDDVILMAGYRIGPFDVESVLARHEAVAEVAVVGAPDQLRGEVLVAFVVLRPTAQPSGDLVAELQRSVKTQFAAHAYPRAIHFVPELPKTPSGKIQRFLLRRHLPSGSPQM
ncbi:acetyl-CoA synthetase [Streptosporangium subroseum]|uniref:Acetyl-CoA synthetase n=1 Tax=Streptosporangium subroseum TaxID=106412 RepID=A0A239P7A4_9ACTN|nr:AMP-binding protein [Streptosporangium subroseum]SNT62905.1 acetyl-CoA synthetase [Streptosporangium subroseum]